MTKKVAGKFSGILAEQQKITMAQVLGAHLLAATDPTKIDDALATYDAYASEIEAKIDALAEHYGVDSPTGVEPALAIEAYRSLLLAVASDFVPGFSQGVKGGRPPKWDHHMKWLLVSDMERYIVPDDPSRTVSYAAAQLAKKWYWKDFVETKEGALESSTTEAIRQVYNKNRTMDPSLRIFDDLWREKPKNEWDRYVAEEVLRKQCKLTYGENWEAVYYKFLIANRSE